MPTIARPSPMNADSGMQPLAETRERQDIRNFHLYSILIHGSPPQSLTIRVGGWYGLEGLYAERGGRLELGVANYGWHRSLDSSFI